MRSRARSSPSVDDARGRRRRPRVIVKNFKSTPPRGCVLRDAHHQEPLFKKRVNTLVAVKESPLDFFSRSANATCKVGAASAKKCPEVHRRVPSTSSSFQLTRRVRWGPRRRKSVPKCTLRRLKFDMFPVKRPAAAFRARNSGRDLTQRVPPPLPPRLLTQGSHALGLLWTPPDSGPSVGSGEVRIPLGFPNIIIYI